jgi:zinc and cadmium transporter
VNASAALLALGAVGLISTASFLGAFALVLRRGTRVNLHPLLALSSGAMFGGALLHLMPEAHEQLGYKAFPMTAAGLLLFFAVEKVLQWHHCHEGECDRHVVGPMNLIGDGVHNVIDGMVVAAAFLTSPELGLATTLAVLLHEIPQEIGDFGVLLYSGYTPKKALLLNFLSALGAMVGALIVIATAGSGGQFVQYLLPLAAGGFLYIAGTDLLPELHKERNPGRSAMQLAILAGGIAVMALLRLGGIA